MPPGAALAGARRAAASGSGVNPASCEAAREGRHAGGVTVRVDVLDPAQRLAGLGRATEGDLLDEALEEHVPVASRTRGITGERRGGSEVRRHVDHRRAARAAAISHASS